MVIHLDYIFTRLGWFAFSLYGVNYDFPRYCPFRFYRYMLASHNIFLCHAAVNDVFFEYWLKVSSSGLDWFRFQFSLESERSKPSSRIFLIGEQPNPWDLLQPQDKMSRHRGAEPCRRYGRLGTTSLLSLG